MIFNQPQHNPLNEALELFDYRTLQFLQYLCKKKYKNFVKLFFKMRTGYRFLSNWHHTVIMAQLQRVVDGEITRLIINCPPGFSKTELVVRLFFPYTYIINPRANNMHLSYSADLAWQNSQDAKEIVEISVYQALYPGMPKSVNRAKRFWRTENQGQLMAAPTGGQVTGFRAGRLEDGFQGAMVIDDPIKPEDALFARLRDKVNRRFENTIQSRLARPETPIVLIMQRVHEDDPTGYLLTGGSGEKWHHLVIPAEIDSDLNDYPSEYTHGIPIIYPHPVGYTWPLKVSSDFATALKTNEITWATQYQQTPVIETGEIFDRDWWQHYDAYDAVNSQIVFEDETRIPILYKCIYADTAMKTAESNDYSVFQCWARLRDGRIALLDQERGKWKAPDLRERFMQFCNRHQYKKTINNMGVRAIKVEDKSSGTGLIQEINRISNFNLVTGIPRDKDKVSRARSGAPQIKLGKVLLPRGASFLSDYILEFSKFNSGMTHKHDDQIDPTLDAIDDMIIQNNRINYSEVI